MTERVPSIRAAGITKRFGSLVANDHIDIEGYAGEVLAIVGENVVLGHEPAGVLFDRSAARAKVGELSEQYGLKLDPDARVSSLSVGLQQRVEILKVLYWGSDILIFDEPTAVLTPQEARELFVVLRGLADQG